tara:strand:- start:1602 stop:1760 length:159 start_codon:yes stop_codon:yes gene_type:complete
MAKERRKKEEDVVTIVSNVHPLFVQMLEVHMPQPTIQEVSALEDEESKKADK